MAFLEQRISVALRRGTVGGPTTLRAKVYDGAGRLAKQVFKRSLPLHRYRFDFGNKVLEDAEEIRSFFYVVMFSTPPYSGFRGRDWNDYKLTQANSRLTLISGSNYQINRVYTAGASQFLRPIYKTEANTVIVYRTRSAVVTVATVTVDNNLGQVAVTGHVGGDTYTCEGKFDIPVTFAADDAMANIGLDGVEANILQSLGEIEMEEVAPT